MLEHVQGDEATTERPASQDPLVAALPPATDYITYLTLLEYQLNPHNLPVLNSLLCSDNGRLAEEIGWDLLKLVLPMLSETPIEATRCLEAIARRGNPREVVVKIAETLESLGEDLGPHLEEDGGYDEDSQDDLPTFTGEAERIHLGNMTLAGMPGTQQGLPEGDEQSVAHDIDKTSDASLTTAAMQFQKLLDMLSILHPRIKTQYPSRFLATSLPAALRAVRRLRAVEGAPLGFFSFIGKLSGKQKPALPARVLKIPVSGEDRSTAQPSEAPLPDPEAPAAESEQETPSENEMQLVSRLLVAVMLEVLDEYAASWQFQGEVSMSWMIRLREKMEPQRSVPGKPTVTEHWGHVTILQQREAMFDLLTRLSEDLNFNATESFQQSFLDAGEESANTTAVTDKSSPPSEFPKSPSDIPLCRSSILVMFAAHIIRPILSSGGSSYLPTAVGSVITSIDFVTFFSALQPFIDPNQHSPQPVSPITTDSALALLYLALTTDPTKSLSLTQSEGTLILSTLLKVRAVNPDQNLRDASHHLAHKIFNAMGNNESISKPGIVRSLLHDNQLDQPAVKAAILGWVKNDFAIFVGPNGIPEAKPKSNYQITARSMNPAILEDDTELETLLFPTIPPITPEMAAGDDELLQLLTLLLPYYIASVNLYGVLRARTDLVSTRAEMMVQGLGSVLNLLLQRDEMSADVWALEDALNRAHQSHIDT